MKLKPNLLRKIKYKRVLLFIILPIITVFIIIIITILKFEETQKNLKVSRNINSDLSKKIVKLTDDFQRLKSTDQIKRNDNLENTIKEIEKTYENTVTVYENLLDLPTTTKELPNYRKDFAKILKLLSERNYSSGSAVLKSLSTAIDKEKQSYLATVGGIDISALTNTTTPPESGYQRQAVSALGGNYIVDIVAGNLANTRVIVDTASDSDCHDNCPTLPLATYVSRNGAYAGINGSYFCPAEYPSCAGKTNTFDTLAMNSKKHYFNSENNVYSTVPAVIFGGGWVRFVGRSLEWGRDTGVDGVLANQPLLLSGGNVTFGGDADPKKGSKGNRSFVASRGSTVYIGVIRNVTVSESAQVLKAMGMENALNLDSGGSTALWSGGYKAGPGRNIPNAILLINK